MCVVGEWSLEDVASHFDVAHANDHHFHETRNALISEYFSAVFDPSSVPLVTPLVIPSLYWDLIYINICSNETVRTMLEF